jgi:hypothetical protein
VVAGFFVGDRVVGPGYRGVVVRVGEKYIWVRRDGEMLVKPSLPTDVTPEVDVAH